MSNKNKKILTDDTTKYGEFICSFHQWLPISKQKEKAKEIENMTKPNEK